jgi:CheY-like chemotaxis protein
MTRPSRHPHLVPSSRTGAADTGRVRLVTVAARPGAGEDDEPGSTSRAESKPDEIDEPAGPMHGRLPEIARNEPDTGDAEAETFIPLRLLLVDDSQLFLGTLQRLLDTLPSVVVVGLATSGREALELVDRLRPDIVLTDLAMPEMDGLELARRLAARPERPMIIMMSIGDLPTDRQATREAGADAFVTKPDLVNQLEPLMRHLLNHYRSGGSYTI